jgi:hypothetical protein
MNPKIFIGSSTGALKIANEIKRILKSQFHIKVWSEVDFYLSDSTLNNLLRASKEYDYGIFVLAPDDLGKIKNKPSKFARDNVIFELGMFYGALGFERCFFIVPSDVKDFRIPTDLLGINYAPYQYANIRSGDFKEIVGACLKIKRTIDHFTKSYASLSGLWDQTWDVRKNKRNSRFSSPAKIVQVGNKIKMEFQFSRRKYVAEGIIERGNVITGTWNDHGKGPSYSGAYQLIIGPSQNELKGKWVGWSKSNIIRHGNWNILKRDDVRRKMKKSKSNVIKMIASSK